MNKKTLRLIGNLNNLYDTLWNMWIQTCDGSFEFDEYTKKLQLVRVIAKKIEEQGRGLLKSRVNYVSGGEYILENFSQKYEVLHKEVSEILLSTH